SAPTPSRSPLAGSCAFAGIGCESCRSPRDRRSPSGRAAPGRAALGRAALRRTARAPAQTTLRRTDRPVGAVAPSRSRRPAAPRLSDERLAALVRGARAAILPAISDATGLPALEAIACGTPVVASAVGALPEIVGSAGIVVQPRDPDRLASALATTWSDDRVH